MGKKKTSRRHQRPAWTVSKKSNSGNGERLSSISSLFSSVMMQFMTPEAASSAARRGQEVGRFVACLLGVFVGSAMIIVHLVRSKKK